MKRWQIIILAILIVGLLGGLYVYFFVVNKNSSDYENATPDYVMSAKAIFNAYKDDKVKAEKNYNGKVIQIKASMKYFEDRDSLVTIVFVFAVGDFGDEGVRCTLLPKYNEEIRTLKPGDFVNIKGYCTGILGADVIFTKCTIIQN